MAIQKITAKIIADGGISAADVADGSITNAKIDSVANTKITGLVTSGQIANVANTQVTGSIEATQVGTTVSQLFGMRNRIINGAMMVDQRNAGASVSATTTSYSVDRWQAYASQTSKYTIQQVSGNAPTTQGFAEAIKVTSSSAYSVISTDIFFLRQIIEGYNIRDLAFGTASAKTITLSFWVRSSLTGTFGGALTNDSNRSYPFTYTISAADTWEYKTITVSGDTSGTWGTTNGSGLSLIFSLGAGSTREASAGAWTGANYYGATGETSVVGTSGATWYLVGVQLEVGSTATPFEWRAYGKELALCQRYYYRIKGTSFGVGQCFSTTGALGVIPFPVTMRTSPTALEQSGTASDYRIFGANTAGINCNAVPVYNATTGFQFGYYDLSVASGLVAGNITNVVSGNSNAYLGWSAEL